VLAGQLEAARRILGAIDARPPAGPLDDPVLSEEFERIRWFVLPAEARADLLAARGASASSAP
jgi:hypothetical protein